MTDLEREVATAIRTFPGMRFDGLVRVIPPAKDKEIMTATGKLISAGIVRRNGDRLYPVAEVIGEDCDGMTFPQALALAAAVVVAFVAIGIILAKFS